MSLKLNPGYPHRYFLAAYTLLAFITFFQVIFLNASSDWQLSSSDLLFLTVDIITLSGFSDHYIYQFSDGQLIALACNLLLAAFLHVFMVCWYFIKLVFPKYGSYFPVPKNTISLVLHLIAFFTGMVLLLGGLLYYAVQGNVICPSFNQELVFVFFQSVSAFTNTGFDLLYSGNYEFFKEQLLIYHLVIAFGVLAGGIGYFTIIDLIHFKVLRYRFHHPSTDWKAFTKIAGIYTMLAGGVFLLVFYRYTPQDLPVMERIFHALFASVHPKTGGFEMAFIEKGVIYGSFIIMAVMLIGGNSCGTASGIKPGVVYALLKGAYHSMTHQYITKPNAILLRLSLKVVLIALVLNMTIAVLIFFTKEHIDVSEALFLSIAAFSNVGWWMDGALEPKLVKYLLMINMLAGRIALPFIVLNLLLRKLTDEKYKYIIS